MIIKVIRQIAATLERFIALFLFLALWEVLPRVGVIDPFFLPPLSTVISTIVKMILTGELSQHLLASLRRTLTGFILGFAFAVTMGLIIGWFSRVERFADILLQSFRQTSALALFPIFILFFGIGEMSKAAIIFWGVQWPILLNTISGVKNIDPLLIKSARSMGASQWTIFRKVVFPASLPSIFTGTRLSATSAVLLLIAAEMVGAKAGLGYMMFEAQQNFQIPRMYAAILIMSIIGFTANYLLVHLENKYSMWKEKPNTIDS